MASQFEESTEGLVRLQELSLVIDDLGSESATLTLNGTISGDMMESLTFIPASVASSSSGIPPLRNASFPLDYGELQIISAHASVN